MKTLCLTLAAAVTAGLLSLSATPASACTIAIEYDTLIGEHDLPDCAAVRGEVSAGLATITVDNGCQDALVLEGADCPTCEDPRTLAAGSSDEAFEVESRAQASSVTLAWTLGDQGGEIAVDVEFADGDAGDDGDPCGAGCRLGARGPGGAAMLGLLLALGAGAGRRRRGRLRP